MHKCRILFVDDEQNILSGFRRLLHNQTDRWELDFANSAKEALNISGQKKYDVFVLDVNMPYMNGLELLARFTKDLEYDFEAIMLTGLEDEELKRRALDIGATDLLTKPVSKEDLIARLNNVIDKKSYRESLQQKSLELEKEVTRRIVVEQKLVATLKKLKETNAKLEEQSIRDSLTKLFNRRYFDIKLLEYYNLSIRLNKPLGCILIDIDHFKKINDTYGHLVGDSALSFIAGSLSNGIRSTDILARYGGEEFIILLPDTNVQAGIYLAEKLRQRIETSRYIVEEITLDITISLGVSSTNSTIKSAYQLVGQSDKALYKAKESGRNNVQSINP